MRSVLSTLACLLLFWLTAFALTEAEIIQAVRDFEQDPDLPIQSASTEPMEICLGETTEVTAYLAVSQREVGGTKLSRMYFVSATPSPHVISASNPENSSVLNSAAQHSPVTSTQAEAIAQAYAVEHHPNHASTEWKVTTVDGPNASLVFHYNRILANNAETSVGGCIIEVCLDTGQVVEYYQNEAALSPGADQPPALGLEDAKARAAQELDLGQRTMQGKLIVNGDGRLVYRLLPDYTQDEMATSEDALPTDIEIDANTGALVSKDYWKGGAAPRESPGLASYVPVMLAAFAIVGLLLFFRKRAKN